MIRKIAATAAACAVCSTGHAFDSISYQVGRGADQTNLLRFGLVSAWRERETTRPDWVLKGYWEVFAGLWDNPQESTAEVGATPVFRLQRRQFYFEGGLGVHLMERHISADRIFSTVLQFGSHFGVGVRSGRYDFGMRVQHISNASIDSPNPGINFVLVRLQYDLQ